VITRSTTRDLKTAKNKNICIFQNTDQKPVTLQVTRDLQRLVSETNLEIVYRNGLGRLTHKVPFVGFLIVESPELFMMG